VAPGLWLGAAPSQPLWINGMRWVKPRARPLRHHPWVIVWVLAVAQVISWGSLYYSFSLFVVPMQETLGCHDPC